VHAWKKVEGGEVRDHTLTKAQERRAQLWLQIKKWEGKPVPGRLVLGKKSSSGLIRRSESTERRELLSPKEKGGEEWSKGKGDSSGLKQGGGLVKVGPSPSSLDPH